jgi:hypothetical protein
MKAIKIVDSNREKIEEALAVVNGRAAEFTTAEYAEVVAIADNAAKDIISSAGAKKYLPGCRVIRCNASSVAKKYKYARIATELVIEYRKSGAYLADIRRVELWPDKCGYRVIHLTSTTRTAIEQHAVAQLNY